VSGRGKLGIDMREIWTLQPRFEKRTGSSPYSMLEQPRFRAGFDFLRLRGQTGEIDIELAEWWETFSTAYDDERHAMIEVIRLAQLQKPQGRTRVRRVDAPAPRDPRFDTDTELSAATPGEEPEFSAEAGDAPVKKRRRRRKPVNRDNGGGEGGGASGGPSDGAPGV